LRLIVSSRFPEILAGFQQEMRLQSWFSSCSSSAKT
jgi:hypothetical protein